MAVYVYVNTSACMHTVCMYVCIRLSSRVPPLLGLVFFGGVFGSLSGCAFDWCWAVHHAMAATSDKPKGLNKMPAQSATEGRSSFRQALLCLLVISSRLQYDAHVCSLRSSAYSRR